MTNASIGASQFFGVCRKTERCPAYLDHTKARQLRSVSTGNGDRFGKKEHSRHGDAVIETEQRTDPVPRGCYRTHASVLINGVPSSRKNSILSAKAPRERVRKKEKMYQQSKQSPII
ncbi:hypothetical protein TNCT_628211 [Trichonephila clavata]|uniref:Uncharacterized protein n=1 Tax=Trichonephila clavata TaxID=2740835 RepID=A0A8X6FRV3_TRICU|nr:hypothetical protein TNCT_628211 [Trichonephila clavata]